MTDGPSIDVARTALELADEAIDFAPELGVMSRRLEGGTTVVDLGIEAPGSREGGLLLAAARRGGLVTTDLALDDLDGLAWPVVEASTDHPAVATDLAATRSVEHWHVSGPAVSGHHEPFAVAAVVGTEPIEAADAEAIADALEVDTGELYLLGAAPGSLAWGVDAAVETLERAVESLASAGHEGPIDHVAVAAPAVAGTDDAEAARRHGRACRRLGGRVHLQVTGSTPSLDGQLPGEDGPAAMTLVDGAGRVTSAGETDLAALAAELRA